MNLKKNIYEGVLWTFIDVVLNKLIFFIATIFIARIIGPEVYGLIGMITVFITIGNSLVEGGMSISLIRSPKIDEVDLSSVFIGSIVMSVFIYLIHYVLAPYIALFFNQPILINVVRVYCLIFLVTSFSAVQLAILSRNMEFKKISLLKFLPNMLAVFVGIYSAYLGWGIWSLITMYLLQQVVFTILLWVYSDWKFKLIFSKQVFIKHIKFGSSLTLSGILNTTFNNFNNILIGKYYPVSQSAFYERAYSLNQYPATVFTAIITKVSMPVLSKIQEDKEQVIRLLTVFIKFSFFIMSFMMTIIIVFSEELIILILGKTWREAIPYLKIIALASVFLPIHTFNVNILKIYGRSDLFLKAEIIKKAFQVLCVLILFRYGIEWTISSLVFLSIFELFLNSIFVEKVIDFGFKKQFYSFGKILALFIVVLAISYSIKMNWSVQEHNYVFNLGILCFMFLCFYAYLMLFEKKELKILKKDLFKR